MALEEALASGTGPVPLVRAAVFGLGAAIAGAILYYAIIAITNLEIGLVAIVIGYMVGWAVRKGAGERGGRLFQVIALVLTYLSVGMAYLPLAMKGINEISARALVLVFTLPFLVVFGSLPSGLISALIIGFGMMQAWRMTAAHQISIAGPFKVGPAAA
jgi:hypothetical protein